MTAEEMTVETYSEASSTTWSIRIKDRSLVSSPRTWSSSMSRAVSRSAYGDEPEQPNEERPWTSVDAGSTQQ